MRTAFHILILRMRKPEKITIYGTINLPVKIPWIVLSTNSRLKRNVRHPNCKFLGKTVNKMWRQTDGFLICLDAAS